MIKLDEKGCIDTLNVGERIKVARVANTELLAYCPYQDCEYTCFWGNIYAHIRKKHHPDFPRLDDLIRYQIKTKDGDKVLDLRCESVRNSVAVGEPLCAIPFEYNKR
ncbi:hypothetical protein BJV82DRAFT_618436 [Fennellomyces sp. T-0311]|nr:hypothetical protein BJV82DRAFT_618436 [Fennellomyces sp. T-0311]